MSDIALKVEGLGKSYQIRKSNNASYSALRDVMTDGVREMFSNVFNGKKPIENLHKPEEFWALKDVSFELKKGEVLGVIGRNGAGKSTLLKLLSRVTEPTKGKILLNGRVSSLLEVGTGFHPELTGRENVYLSGAILGMTRKEIKNRFDEIVDFAGIEQFIDTPVKRYSSGMYVRLGFAVAAHLETEILLVDEVLAVGDMEYQKKCITRMTNLVSSGNTVIVVSHDIGLVKTVANKCVTLHKGELQFFGNTNAAIIDFIKKKKKWNYASFLFSGPLRNKVSLKKISINNTNPSESEVVVGQFEDIEMEMDFNFTDVKNIRLAIAIFYEGTRLFSSHAKPITIVENTIVSYKALVPSRLLRPGEYTIGIGGVENNEFGDWFWNVETCSFSIIEQWGEGVEIINSGLLNVNVEFSHKIIKL